MSIIDTKEITELFYQSTPKTQAKIADELENLAKSFNHYIDDNYYVCPHCSQLIAYGAAKRRFEEWVEHLQHYSPFRSNRIYEGITLTGYRYYCPHCDKRLWGDYEEQLNKREHPESE